MPKLAISGTIIVEVNYQRNSKLSKVRKLMKNEETKIIEQEIVSQYPT